MPGKPLHIISFDNPYPPVYGGVVDVFYKIAALHSLGYEIYLHCFVKGYSDAGTELKAVTKQVYFYSARSSFLHALSGLPFSVATRAHKSLLSNLQNVDAPILFESLKTTKLVHQNKILGRKMILRQHNIEQDYFAGLSASEKSPLRKFLYYTESLKFRRYDRLSSKFDHIAALSVHENEANNNQWGNSVYIPVFHGNKSVADLGGKGTYVLYHGDLNSADNFESVKFLISAFSDLPYRFIIAAGSREDEVLKLTGKNPNFEFVNIKSFDHLKNLIAGAHINISWSFQRSGTKLKVINALFNGRFAVINENIIDDAVVADLCHVVTDRETLRQKIAAIMEMDYSEAEHRSNILESHLSDAKNARLLAKLLEAK